MPSAALVLLLSGCSNASIPPASRIPIEPAGSSWTGSTKSWAGFGQEAPDYIALGTDLKPGWWLKTQGLHIAIVGETQDVWLIELDHSFLGGLNPALEGEALLYGLLVSKSDGRVVDAYLGSPGELARRIRVSSGNLSRETQYAVERVRPRASRCTQSTTEECSLFTPTGSRRVNRTLREFQCLSEDWALSTLDAEQTNSAPRYDFPPRYDYRRLVTYRGSIAGVSDLLVRFEEFRDRTSEQPKRAIVLLGAPEATSVTIAAKTLIAWRVTYLKSTVRYTALLTDHPVVRGLSPAVWTAPSMGVISNTLFPAGDDPTPTSVRDFGVDAVAQLVWPAEYTVRNE